MKFSLAFENSGDVIPLQTINNKTADVLCYYVDHLNEQNLNKFALFNSGNKIDQAIKKLHATIGECNEFIYELLDYYIPTYSAEDYLDQRVLNKLHADWVNSQSIQYNIIEKRKKYNNSVQAELIHTMFPDEIPDPPLATIIDKLGFKNSYNNINLDVHALESLLSKIKFVTADHPWVEFTNPFGSEILTNDIGNFSLSFNHLGRTLYNKFLWFDHSLEFDDENSFDQLLGFVEINLQPPQSIPLSNEYVAWCRTHNKVPSGDNLNIGNITNLQARLTDYRKIIFQNTLQNNIFSIELHKGN
jgi:hypothetical protein